MYSPHFWERYLKWRNPHLYKLYDIRLYGYTGSFPTLKIAENKVTRKPSILGTTEILGELRKGRTTREKKMVGDLVKRNRQEN